MFTLVHDSLLGWGKWGLGRSRRHSSPPESCKQILNPVSIMLFHLIIMCGVWICTLPWMQKSRQRPIAPRSLSLSSSLLASSRVTGALARYTLTAPFEPRELRYRATGQYYTRIKISAAAIALRREMRCSWPTFKRLMAFHELFWIGATATGYANYRFWHIIMRTNDLHMNSEEFVFVNCVWWLHLFPRVTTFCSMFWK